MAQEQPFNSHPAPTGVVTGSRAGSRYQAMNSRGTAVDGTDRRVARGAGRREGTATGTAIQLYLTVTTTEPSPLTAYAFE
jgi:hypothetical protein